MADPLAALLTALEHPFPAVFGESDVRFWPREVVLDLEKKGVMAPAAHATAVECDSCGQGHVEPVTEVQGRPDRPRRWCIRCPTDGTVWVPAERLRRWQVRPTAIGRSLTRVEPTERLPDRVWRLGPLGSGRHSLFAWLVVGWRGEEGLAERVPELVQSNAVVFVPNDLPPSTVWGKLSPPRLIPLSAILALGTKELAVDRDAVAAHLPTASERPSRDQVQVQPHVSLPPNTSWEQITLIVDDHHLELLVEGHRSRHGFEELGFVKSRAKGISLTWETLRLLAREGELDSRDGIATKHGSLKNRVSQLRKTLQALTGLTEDPFHPTKRLQPYRPRFHIRASE